MSDDSTSLVVAYARGNMNGGTLDSGPPPSTLAAQLVENISASTKSSRSDENSELKNLFAVIQRVKDDPQLLKTPNERVEHNHMLIYVYCRVVLEGVKLDDPFLDRNHVQAEVRKALNFLKFTIKETPSVLCVQVDGGRFLFRGQEPLWIWLFPQLLRLLGHPQCIQLSDSIEDVLKYILLMAAQIGALWQLVPLFVLYLRSSLSALLDYLLDPSRSPTSKDASIRLSIPPTSTLDQLLGHDKPLANQRVAYNVDRLSQALRQSISFASILGHTLVSNAPAFEHVASFRESSTWFLDMLIDLRIAHRRWESLVPISATQMISLGTDLATKLSHTSGPFTCFQDKAVASLILLCGDMVSDSIELTAPGPSGESSRRDFCIALVTVIEAAMRERPLGRLAASKLVDDLLVLSTQAPSVSEETDVWRTTQILQHVTNAPQLEAVADNLHPSRFQDESIRKAIQELGLSFANSRDDVSKPAKRRKLSSQDTGALATLTDLINKILNIPALADGDVVIFEQAFLDAFEKANEPQQCLAVELLSRTCCLADEKVELADSSSASLLGFECKMCSSNTVSGQSIPLHDNRKGETQLIFTKLIRSSTLAERRKARVAIMISAKKVLLHCNDLDVLDLETSELGKLCLQSLNSSIRELRIAAGRCLTLFLLDRPTTEEKEGLVERNRKTSIALLKTLSEKNQPNMVETCIMAWGQLGRVFTENELNVVLIKLLEYLGSNNNMASSFAFNELMNLAEARKSTPRRLFEPFWRSLAYLTTKDMVHRPQMSRAVAELLQISVNDLLLLIQTHALPWLVLDKRKDVIQKLAEARQEQEVWRPLMDSHNLASTLALLLVQDTEDIEGFTTSRLNQLSPHFHTLSLASLLKSEPVLTAMELLKAAGDADDGRKELPRKALQMMATMVLPTNRESRSKKGNAVGRFLHSHLLGLMARFTDIINAVEPPVIEQRRCIRGMEEMIKVCKSYARIARPQISACLLSALTQDTLRDASFSCWAAMITHLEEEDAEALLDTSFFIVNRYWTSLDRSTATTAKDILSIFVSRYEGVVSKHISKLPSLRHIPELKDIEAKLNKLRPSLLAEEAFKIFAERLRHENSGVVLQALYELVPFLQNNQDALHASAITQQPDTIVAPLMRSLLDCVSKYNGIHSDIPRLCTESMGLIGCLDSNKTETVREQRSIVILNNFEDTTEVTDFGIFLLQEVLVPAFLSATDTTLQGFLSFAMQELLYKCDIRAACAMEGTGMTGGNEVYRKWLEMPEATREVVTPFLRSRYMVAPMAPVTVEYPIFRPGKPYGNWLRSFVVDLLRKGQNQHAQMIFEPLTRVIRVKDLATAEFLLPYLVLHILLGTRSTDKDKERVLGELLGILQHQTSERTSSLEMEDTKRFCHAVFRVIDYALQWVQAKRSSGRPSDSGKASVLRIQNFLDAIPAELLSQRAIDCNDYARALFHLEQHAQNLEQKKRQPGERTRLLEQLQDIYANIDEPDGLEGTSAHLHLLDINQQILGHKKAGRWTAAQSWYEMQLAKEPDNVEVQIDLLNCLKQAGQHDVLLNHIEGMHTGSATENKIMPFAVEAAWVTGRWESLTKFATRFHGSAIEDFNISLATIFDSLRRSDKQGDLGNTIHSMREKISSSMNSSTTASLQACHDLLLKCHVLTDLEIIMGANAGDEKEHKKTMALLDRRLEIIGAYSQDKQYLLGIRRAAMELTRPTFSDWDISGLWLASARLARKTGSLPQSFNAVLHASQLGDDAATIENAKLLWRDNHHRKAIQMLQGAIERNKFMTQTGASEPPTATGSTKLNSHQKLLTARAQLLLAKWLDAAGQTHASALREKYQQPPKTHSTWEKGHYYLGRHYKKILESEKPLKVDDQSDNYVTGEIARLVIENYVRSLNSGTKYLYQTLPRILTIWLDLGAQVNKAPEGKVSLSRELCRRRQEQLRLLHSFLDKYIQRLPAYVFYTALPQIVARLAHPNGEVFDRLAQIIGKVVEAHPRQALWSLIGIMTSRQDSGRKARGMQIIQALRSIPRKVDGTSYDLKYLLRTGEKLAEQLLLTCQNGDFQGNKTVHASLTKDLRFNHKCTPCPLVVPVESSLTATLPAVSEYVKKHKAFSRDVVSIDCFLDDVLVLSSLARPRRLTARGTDGKSYMLLIKPKDDLRTDQRLMEFNGIINRSLIRDAQSSQRQLYIRTYAVTPLNEECGIIEWVPGIKTMRDILISLYASRKIHPDYMTLRQLMDEASMSESKIRIFTDDVLGRFPPVLHLWFTQQFPNPSAWFAARLRYTRSCAVMSMVGTILGLGDRHGENVNLEEGNGGIFHVDFNCLFDKGLTFAKPERVPFRLTHNMVAAMGTYGYEGPFRKSCELTLSILRQQEETLMTILEAFIYDPTLDLQKEKRTQRRGDVGVKLQPQSVVDSIKRKVQGLLPNESIPLGVEGQVDELIKQAVDPRNLAAMYIGWCPFL